MAYQSLYFWCLWNWWSCGKSYQRRRERKKTIWWCSAWRQSDQTCVQNYCLSIGSSRPNRKVMRTIQTHFFFMSCRFLLKTYTCRSSWQYKRLLWGLYITVVYTKKNVCWDENKIDPKHFHSFIIASTQMRSYLNCKNSCDESIFEVGNLFT